MRVKLFSIVSAFAFIFVATPALSSPQILGLVATAQPVPLTCVDGICKAEITTVCLQEHRRAPMPGRSYTAAKGTEITLNILAADGSHKSIAIAQKVSLTAQRHYTSVALSLPEKTLREFGYRGLQTVSVSVGAMASAIPVAQAGDKKPLSAIEIAEYTGPMRQVARGVFHQDSDRVATTRLLNQVINRLPDDLANDEADFEKNWQKVSKDASHHLTPAVREKTGQIAATCRDSFRVGVYATLRSCLEQHHDYLAAETNNKVWEAMKPGG